MGATFSGRVLLAAALLSGLSVASGPAAAGISWAQAREMLRAGKGLTHEPALGDPVANPDAYGAGANDTGDPLGGGSGYRDVRTGGDFAVRSRDDLVAALRHARSKQVVYVAPDAAIDLSGLTRIQLPDGVTLAGGRGLNGAQGALLHTSDFAGAGYRALFHTGTKSRITGLRIRGPDPDYSAYTAETRDASAKLGARCILAGEESEVDNCEVSNFYRDGIAINTRQVRVHHGFLRDIAAYPVIIGSRPGASALIEANIIHWGWHATAGAGGAGTGYEARYNLCVPHRVPAALGGRASHCLDQHADRAMIRAAKQYIAGDWLTWHHNTIALDSPSVVYDPARSLSSPGNGLGMKIRGTPRILAQVYGNWLGTTDPVQALGPYGGPGEQAHGNVWVYDNVYGPDRRSLRQIASRTTPQILFKRPGLPAAEPELVRGRFTLEIEVHTLPPLRIAGVIVMLDENTLYLEPRAPRSGEVSIDADSLSPGPHKLAVSAIDNRGALGTQCAHIARGD